jgi:hypothetical protein
MSCGSTRCRRSRASPGDRARAFHRRPRSPNGAADDNSPQALAFKRPARDRKDRQYAMRRRTDLLGRSGRQTQPHQDGHSSSPQLSETRLEQFMNGVDRTFSASVAARHRYEMVQECIRWMCGFPRYGVGWRRNSKCSGNFLATFRVSDHRSSAGSELSRSE